jgi:hypothetical protein
MNRSTPKLSDVRHMKVCYSKERYCGHISQGGIYNFGNGEIAMIHTHAHCTYETTDSVNHGVYGKAGVHLLQRSLDHGETWSREHDVVVWNNAASQAEKDAIHQKANEPGVERESIDLSSTDTAIWFQRYGPPGEKDARGNQMHECYAFRSADRGRTWERVPTRLKAPHGYDYPLVDGYPPVRFPDGTLAVASDMDQYYVAVYGTDDNGLNWRYLALLPRDPDSQSGRMCYPRMLRLPGGRLQCYMLNLAGQRNNVIVLTCSDDGGFSWSTPKPIVAWGQSPWARLSREHVWSGAMPGPPYRSPWPLQLRDGRIAVIFGRRVAPYGMGLIVSEDEGETWSAEAVIRADGSDWDLAYPVATQLDDGRIFTAYYYMQNDGNNHGGTRYIAGSFFGLD